MLYDFENLEGGSGQGDNYLQSRVDIPHSLSITLNACYEVNDELLSFFLKKFEANNSTMLVLVKKN